MMAVKLQSTSYPGQGHQLQHLVEDAADAPQVDGGGVVLRPQGKLLWHVPLGSDWGGGQAWGWIAAGVLENDQNDQNVQGLRENTKSFFSWFSVCGLTGRKTDSVSSF